MDHITAVCAMAIMCATESSVSNNNDYTIDYTQTNVNTQIINKPVYVYDPAQIENIRQDVYNELYQELNPLTEEMVEAIRQDILSKVSK